SMFESLAVIIAVRLRKSDSLAVPRPKSDSLTARVSLYVCPNVLHIYIRKSHKYVRNSNPALSRSESLAV
ncbi:hypothetical protein L9F63_017092, partial [Diploptera punctata]